LPPLLLALVSPVAAGFELLPQAVATVRARTSITAGRARRWKVRTIDGLRTGNHTKTIEKIE
jgi:hypothetical protein